MKFKFTDLYLYWPYPNLQIFFSEVMLKIQDTSLETLVVPDQPYLYASKTSPSRPQSASNTIFYFKEKNVKESLLSFPIQPTMA